MLPNAYFLANFRFDTAENEPAKKLQNLQNLKCNFCRRRRARRPARLEGREEVPGGEVGLAKLANFCKFLAGSFSALSKRNFARKYAFDSIFQALQDLHPFAPLQSQNFSKKSV